MIDSWIIFGEGFLLVFAINARESFNELKRQKAKISQIKGSVPIVLVGNKSDLEEERVISEFEAQQLAQEWNCTYIETSAKVKLLHS